MSEQLAYIVWINERTEAQGHGSPVPESEARAWAAAMNRKYPDMKHHIVRVTGERNA